MSTTPPDTTQTVDDSAVTYCYGHPKTPTRLRCTRCDKPICGRCAVPASVGQHCVWCVAEAKKSAPKVRSTLQASAPVVMGIIVVSVIVYGFESFLGREFINRFAAFGPAIALGEWYRLITPMFLHAPLGGSFGIFHILFNMYILYIYGPSVEQAFGHVRFAVMYLVAGFSGGVLSYALGPFGSFSLGASGAVFGMVGALLVYLRRRQTTGWNAQYVRSLSVFVGINLVIGFVIPGIDNWAHIGGLAAGAALSLGLDAGDGVPVNPARQIATVAGVTAVGILIVMWRTESVLGSFGL